ncbi:MAG TPA: DUF2185 domain-containing protein [Sphingomicrobium sp.]|nr:DUF2185 domain-containing protein [Sphingomicrobium sp.]
MSYVLSNAPSLHAAAPYTFFLPHPLLIDALRVGDLAKVIFEYDPPGETYEAERMWVEIKTTDDGRFAGILANRPSDPKSPLVHGESVEFTRDHIVDVQLNDPSSPDEYREDKSRYPQIPTHREYWSRCLVDRCVLDDATPVEYLYREEPEAGEMDSYPDSGWRIRGRQGSESDQGMEERPATFVALGAVLNRDDSWIDLIDAPIGSAFTRNFQTNLYEPVG